MAMNNNGDTSKQGSNKSELFVSLDIGSSKVCSVIASADEKADSLKILGIGITESEGISKGVVSNIDKSVKSIQKAVEQAEQQSGQKIRDVVVGIAGGHIESFQTRSIIAVSSQSTEISHADVKRLLEEARKVSIPTERKIIHVIPQDYIIDGQDGITDPVGMSGVRMEANVHIVTGSSIAIQNIYRCVERAGLSVREIVLESLASSNAVLNEEEKEVGVALIDVGGGTTDIAIFVDNILRWTSTIAVAGKHVTDDIRHGLGIITSQAERIKKEYGHAFGDSVTWDEVFMIPGIAGRKPLESTKSILCQIIEPRMEEIFEFAFADIKRSGYANRLGAGIVVTGGCSLLRGSDELAGNVFGMPVKIGIPAGISYSGLGPEIESPIYSTAVGLAQYCMKQSDVQHILKTAAKSADELKKPERTSIFNRVRRFIEEL